MDSLEVSSMDKFGNEHYNYTDFEDYVRQLYKTIRKDFHKGDCLINS